MSSECECGPCEFCLLITCLPFVLGCAFCDECCGRKSKQACRCLGDCICGVLCCPCLLTEAAADKWRSVSDEARKRREARRAMDADAGAPPAAKMDDARV